MNKKNLKEKFKNLMSKDGFYIGLLLCLCVILSVGTFSYKKFISNKEQTKTQPTIQDEIKDDEVANNDANSTTQMPNADRADNNAVKEEKKDDKKTEDKKDTADSDVNKETQVANTKNVQFTAPLQGALSREYTYPKPVQVGESTFRTIKGVNIEAEVGTDVKSAAEGVISLVDNTGVEEGMVIEIKHANGLKTRYANLDEEVNVKAGDKVTAGQVIGKVGSTAKVYSEDLFGQFLNLQVIDANGNQVNPAQYFTFSK